MKKNMIFFILIFLIFLFVKIFFKYNSQSFGAWSLLPPLCAIIFSIALREIIPSLFFSIWIGSSLINKGSIFYGFLETGRYYLIHRLIDPYNMGIIFFTLIIGGLIGVLVRIGGIPGIINSISKKVNNAVKAQLATFFMGIFIFFDDYSNTILVGNTLRPLTDKFRISREKLSYIVDSTAAPVASIGIISTWVAYEVGLIHNALISCGDNSSAYLIFLHSIPYRFYSIFALIFVFFIIILKRDFGLMYKAEKRARATGKVLRDGAKPLSDLELGKLSEGIDAKNMNKWNAIIPIATVIILMFIGLWYTGGGTKGASLSTAIGNGDASVSMIWASISGLFVAVLLGLLKTKIPLDDILSSFVEGVKSLTMAIIILVLAWSIGLVTKDLKTGEYIVNNLKDIFKPQMLPVFTFIISMFVAFTTGSSWGTVAIIIPIAVPLIYHYTGNTSDVMFYSTIGSIFTGSVFGDHCSPISDTTIMSSMASACDHIDHVRTQMPYAILVALVTLFAGFFLISIGFHYIISILTGFILLFLLIYTFGKKL